MYHLCRQPHITKIKCYNVEFGDCFLCKNEDCDSVMLVDCGTSPTFNSLNVANDICMEMKARYEKINKQYRCNDLGEDGIS